MSKIKAPDDIVGYIEKSENTVSFNITDEEGRIRKFEYRKLMLDDFFYPQVEEELGNIFISAQETGLIDQIDDTNNIFKMVIEEISKVYDQEPIRTFGEQNSEIDQVLNDFYEELDITGIMEQSNIYMNAFNDILLQVGYNEDGFNFRLRRPDNTIVKYDEDLILQEVYIYKSKGPDGQIWCGYTKDEMFEISVSSPNEVLGHHVDKREPLDGYDKINNPLGFLPFVKIQSGYRDDNFWSMYKGDALVKGNIQVAMKLTILNQLIKYQSFKQIIATANDGNPKSLKDVVLDPASVIYLFGENSKIETLDLESNYKQLWDTIKEINTNIATNYKISPNMFRMTSAPSSGFSLQMENIKLDAFVAKQQKYFKKVEKRLYNMLKQFNDTLSIGLAMPDEFNITFPPMQYPETKQEKLESWEKSIELGKTSMVDILMKEYNIEEAEAIEMYKKNIEYRNQLSERFNNQQPRVNIPTEGN